MRGRCGRCQQFTRVGAPHTCPQRVSRYQLTFPVDAALPEVRRLVGSYGSILRAGYAYADRHGLAAKSGERLLLRILHGHVGRVKESTLDRLEVTV